MFLTHAVLGKLCSIIKVTRKLFTKGIFLLFVAVRGTGYHLSLFFWGGGGGIFLYAVNVALKFRFRYEHTMTR